MFKCVQFTDRNVKFATRMLGGHVSYSYGTSVTRGRVLTNFNKKIMIMFWFYIGIRKESLGHHHIVLIRICNPLLLRIFVATTNFRPPKIYRINRGSHEWSHNLLKQRTQPVSECNLLFYRLLYIFKSYAHI